MIKHIVLWQLKDDAEGQTRMENARQLKAQLEALNGRIPGLRWLEVGLHVEDSHAGEDDADVVLYSEFDDMAALEAYYPHPAHQAVVPFARAIRLTRKVINYEV